MLDLLLISLKEGYYEYKHMEVGKHSAHNKNEH
jgi:hypothetical protein